ncbi:MAG: DUF1730 domain-containing protein [Anaerolineales bacterium]|nr:DUF1730 domain-containing protein [Anaerolineales bacterium]
MDTTALTHAIKQEAHRLGFDFCGVAPAQRAPHADFCAQWLAAGRSGDMTYLQRHVEKRLNPALLAEPADPAFKSMIVLAIDYHRFELPQEIRMDPSRGLIAAYAWGDDYHAWIRPLLYELDAALRTHSGRTSRGKALVDTGPVLERDWAQRTGIGFTGKNCCTIRPGHGSWLLLATLTVPETLTYDPPPAPNPRQEPEPAAILAGIERTDPGIRWHSQEGAWETGGCGRCTRCLDACPTQAFAGPYHLDPNRCIAYWTIETQQSIPLALRRHFGNRIFGCDICQEVCPYNRRLAPRTPALAGLQTNAARLTPYLLDGFAVDTPYWLDASAFAAHFRGSPIKRAKRAGMLRNVCVALGNWASPLAVPALARALSDPESIPRGHAAWALGQIVARHRHQPALTLLQSALTSEPDPAVLNEIRLALR